MNLQKLQVISYTVLWTYGSKMNTPVLIKHECRKTCSENGELAATAGSKQLWLKRESVCCTKILEGGDSCLTMHQHQPTSLMADNLAIHINSRNQSKSTAVRVEERERERDWVLKPGRLGVSSERKEARCAGQAALAEAVAQDQIQGANNATTIGLDHKNIFLGGRLLVRGRGSS